MADRNFQATTDPQNIVSALSLEAGRQYVVFNVDSRAVLRMREAAVKPTGGALRGIPVAPLWGREHWQVTDGLGIWAWTDAPEGCACIVGDVA